ncbi:MAG: hypothetical protein A3G49_06045 [Candidatus Sungbacteria bacterium RIFCSPLOWO2_12_FULL_41_11]|uniref:FAD/NAD(P)-binding domain-containing protein n=1 Tax=Candidatus Sungbacteria bacterium RIFCSPLOWO2_12_FULL_41_11 TaxID=1802286 RepID=A0A1G2LQT7_9BACT|nr:MAG: FAD-dependent pyridine nucleotide-disulfide oxidoreductase [Parcubacteria group bacterium GW2011_GWA2_42_14]OHA13998.1 MAG: hypothetical protein A3G49_06045 [Candidatus Sungbacteria bacterium RIFCSPLOWO2_12_FULL_41_11]
MEKVKYLIIGGGIAGTTAAETIRQNDPVGTIAIVSDEPYRLYSRIMLSKPNFFLEKIPFENVWLKKDSWYTENNIMLLAPKKAISLDTVKKEVKLDDGQVIRYEKLLLAVGGCARQWGIKGSEKKGIFYIRTLDDAKAIISAVKSSENAVAIGGGFISFEMCDMLKLAGINVSLILRESYFWEPLLDEQSGRMIERALEKGGVKIFYNSQVKEIIGADKVEEIVLDNGEKISCNMLMVGIGVVCPFGWVQAGGISVNRGILANEYLETDKPDIWTAGDSAEFNDIILGERVQLGNWVNAQMQGRIAGLNMLGKRNPFKLVSFYTTQGFGITIAFVGDVKPGQDRLVIGRGLPDSGSYGRILVKDGEIMGATLINRTSELGAISKLIEKDIKVSGHEKELGDANFDLKKLING